MEMKSGLPSVAVARRSTGAIGAIVCSSAPIARNRRIGDQLPVLARHIFRCMSAACSPGEEREPHRLGSASCRRRSVLHLGREPMSQHLRIAGRPPRRGTRALHAACGLRQPYPQFGIKRRGQLRLHPRQASLDVDNSTQTQLLATHDDTGARTSGAVLPVCPPESTYFTSSFPGVHTKHDGGRDVDGLDIDGRLYVSQNGRTKSRGRGLSFRTLLLRARGRIFNGRK